MTLQLDQPTMERARTLAELHHCSVEQLVATLVRDQFEQAAGTKGLVGLMSDEPELMDRVMDDVYATRASTPLRSGGNG